MNTDSDDELGGMITGGGQDSYLISVDELYKFWQISQKKGIVS